LGLICSDTESVHCGCEQDQWHRVRMGRGNTRLGRGYAKTILLDREFVGAGQQWLGQSRTTGFGGLGRVELECANSRFRGSDPGICAHTWWARLRVDGVQRPDTGRHVFWPI